ncbi:MAG TPA: hypothetical protein VE525_18670 [Rubrobacter sp.]|nr:hypothetical protein [Rubrobacter sp.]
MTERKKKQEEKNMPTRALWLAFGVLLISALVGIVYLSIGQLDSAPWGTSQSEEVIFVHRATEENVSQNSTYIDHPTSNGNPDAILVVTPNWNPEGSPGIYNAHPIGVWYDSEAQRWAVFNQDLADMPVEAGFNVRLDPHLG